MPITAEAALPSEENEATRSIVSSSMRWPDWWSFFSSPMTVTNELTWSGSPAAWSWLPRRWRSSPEKTLSSVRRFASPGPKNSTRSIESGMTRRTVSEDAESAAVDESVEVSRMVLRS